MRRASKLLEDSNKIFHLGLVEAQALCLVVIAEDLEGVLSISKDVDNLEGRRRALGKHVVGGRALMGKDLGHAVVEDIAKGGNLLLGAGLVKGNGNTLSTLDAGDAVAHAADVGDAGGLGAPWRDVARGDEEGEDVGVVGAEGLGLAGAKVLQELVDSVLDGVGLDLEVAVVDPVALDLRHGDISRLADAVPQRLLVRRREAGAANENVGHVGRKMGVGLLRLAALMKKHLEHRAEQKGRIDAEGLGTKSLADSDDAREVRSPKGPFCCAPRYKVSNFLVGSPLENFRTRAGWAAAAWYSNGGAVAAVTLCRSWPSSARQLPSQGAWRLYQLRNGNAIKWGTERHFLCQLATHYCNCPVISSTPQGSEDCSEE